MAHTISILDEIVLVPRTDRSGAPSNFVFGLAVVWIAIEWRSVAAKRQCGGARIKLEVEEGILPHSKSLPLVKSPKKNVERSKHKEDGEEPDDEQQRRCVTTGRIQVGVLVACIVLKVLSNMSRSSHNPGSTSLQNQPTAYAWVHQSGQPAGSQTQYPHQTQFRPVVTPGGVLPAGYVGTPGGSGLGAGPGGVQGQINFGECALILPLQYADTMIQGAVGRYKPAVGPTIRNLLARDSSSTIRRGLHSFNPRHQVASQVQHSQRVRPEGTDK